MIMNDEQVASETPTDPTVAAEKKELDATTSEGTQPATEAPEGAVGSESVTAEVPAEPAAETTPEPTPAPTPAAASAEPADDLELFEAAMAELDTQAAARARGEQTNYKRISKGDRIEATVIQVEKDRVFVDLGMKSEGVVPIGELTDDNVDSAIGLVNVGDKINVVVLRTDGGDGNPVVSKKRADFDEAWFRVVKAFQDQTMLKATVVDRVKGGLVVDVGVRGFVPATHVGSGKLRNIEKYVGEILDLKVIEIDKERKKVVLSNRAAEEERREQLKDDLFTNVKPGDVLEGTVRRLADYGAFIDLGGLDGLLHISEMSWMRVNHPKEVLKEGQKISVMVLKLDKETGKISLGHRQVLPDPWNLIRDNYRLGQKLTCTITRMVQSGAFVRLPEGAEAFLPVSEISHRRIGKPSDVLTEGQEVELTIIDLRPDERRMVLSLKSGTMPEPQIGYGYGSQSTDMPYDDRKGARRGPGGGGKGKRRDDYDGGSRTSGGGGSSAGGATIRERLGMLKGFHFRSEEDEETEATTPAESTETKEGGDEA